MYNILLASLIAGISAQIIKLIIESFKGSFSIKNLFTYGGMPSSHAAFVGGLVTAVGMQDGFNSATFAIALIFTILIIRDSVGLRRQAGYHGLAIKKLIEHHKKIKFPQIKNRLGHTPAEVTAGLALGIIVALLIM